MTYLGLCSMGPLTALSISLLALRLGGVSDIGLGLILLPAALQGFYNFILAVRAYKKIEKHLKALEEAKEKIKED